MKTASSRASAERAVHDLDAAAAKALGQRVAGAEALDDADPADGLLDERRGLGPAGLQLAGALVVLARVEPGADGHERHRDQHHEREPPVEDEHHDRDGDDGQHVADRVADRVHHPRDVLRVGRGAAQQLARADAVVVGGVEPQRVGEERVAHAGVGVGAVADRVEVAEGAGADLEQPDGEQHEQPDEQRVVVARDDPVVDRVLDDERRGDRAGLPEQAGEHGARDACRCARTTARTNRHAAGRRPSSSPMALTYRRDDDNPIEQRFPRPSVMGVVNVTPDSFSDGGVNFDPDDAVAAARRMLGRGRRDRRRRRRVDASRRRGASSLDEELRRVVPVLEQLAGDVPVSIDTSKAEVAAAGARARRRARQRRHGAARRPGAGRGRRRLRRLPLPDAHAGRAADDAGSTRATTTSSRRSRPSSRSGCAPPSTAGIAGGPHLPRPRASASARRSSTTSSSMRRLDELTALGRPVRDRLLAQELARQAARRPAGDDRLGRGERRRGGRGLRARRDDPARPRRSRARRGAGGRAGRAGMSVVVELRGLELPGRHGVLERERETRAAVPLRHRARAAGAGRATSSRRPSTTARSSSSGARALGRAAVPAARVAGRRRRRRACSSASGRSSACACGCGSPRSSSARRSSTPRLACGGSDAELVATPARRLRQEHVDVDELARRRGP